MKVPRKFNTTEQVNFVKNCLFFPKMLYILLITKESSRTSLETPMIATEMTSSEPELLQAAEFGTRMRKQTGSPAGQSTPRKAPNAEVQNQLPAPARTAGSRSYAGEDNAPHVRAALHAAPESVVHLYRTEAEVEFGTRIPELLPENGKDFSTRKKPMFERNKLLKIFLFL